MRAGSSTILEASLRQSRNMRRTERFYISWLGFIYNCVFDYIAIYQLLDDWNIHIKGHIFIRKMRVGVLAAFVFECRKVGSKESQRKTSVNLQNEGFWFLLPIYSEKIICILRDIDNGITMRAYSFEFYQEGRKTFAKKLNIRRPYLAVFDVLGLWGGEREGGRDDRFYESFPPIKFSRAL